VSDVALTAVIAGGLLGVMCLIAGLLGYVKAEVTWYPPEPDPVDEHHRTLPDLTPWLPARGEPWKPEDKTWRAEELITEIEAFLKERSQ
jgi:hypothetical protein